MLSTLDISCSWILADPDKSGIRATSPLKLPEPAGIPENNRRRSKRDDQDVRFIREINISQIPLRDKYIFCLLTRGPILVEKVQGAMSGRPSHQSADSTDLQIHFSFSVSSSWHYFKGMRFSIAFVTVIYQHVCSFSWRWLPKKRHFNHPPSPRYWKICTYYEIFG